MSNSTTSPSAFRSRRQMMVWALGLGFLWVLPLQVFGVLERDPDSFLLLSSDRSKGLVMTRPVRSRRSGDDAGRWQNLADGRRVDLYTQFLSNGVYRLSDLTPIYFLDWFADSNRFAISPDLEAIAKFNIYAVHGNPTNAVAPRPKAIRFIKNGAEVRSYLAADLVENPAGLTVPSEYYDSVVFWAWLDSFRRMDHDRLEVVTVRRGLFIRDYDLSFVPGNRLVFDLQTGALVYEDRPLGQLRRWIALGLVAAVGLGLALFVFKRSRADLK